MRGGSPRLRFAAALLLLFLLPAAWSDVLRGSFPRQQAHPPSRPHPGAGAGWASSGEEKRLLAVLRGGYGAEDAATEPPPLDDAETAGEEEVAEGGNNANTGEEIDIPWKRKSLSVRRRGKLKEEGDGQVGKDAKPPKMRRGRPPLPPGKDRKRYMFTPFPIPIIRIPLPSQHANDAL